MNLLRYMMRSLKKVSAPSDQQSTQGIIDQYVSAMPSAQNAVDAISGWNHAFPPETGITAGAAHLYQDDRIFWCIDQAGGIVGLNILELGPLAACRTCVRSAC